MDKALQYAVRLLAQRPYSKSRLLFKLKQKGYEAEAVAVLTELEVKGAINDARFAQAFVEQSQLQRPSGKQRVILALRRRGIDQETAVAAWQKWEEGETRSVVGETSSEMEARKAVVGGEPTTEAYMTPTVAAAFAAAQSRLARGDLDLQRWDDRQRLLYFLNRRGFVYTEAKAVLAKLSQGQPIYYEGVERTAGTSQGQD